MGRYLAVSCVWMALVFVGCGDDATKQNNGGFDLGTDLGVDAADAGADTSAPDARVDSGATDATPDAPEDAADTDANVDPRLRCDGQDVVDEDDMVIETCSGTGASVCLRGACVDACAAPAPEPSNLGCSFFAADLPNAVDPSLDITQMPFALTLVNPLPITANVEVHQNAASFGDAAQIELVRTIVVAPNSAEFVLLPSRDTDGSDPSDPVATTGSSSLNAAAYRVTSDVPISVTQHNVYDPTDDNSPEDSLLWPVDSLGSDHWVIGQPQALQWSEETGTRFGATLTIVGTEPDTLINVEVSTNTAGSADIGSLSPGTTFSQRIGAFEVVHLETQDIGGDFTGTRVRSDKPIAVFSGARATDVPAQPRFLCADGNPPLVSLCCADGGPEDPVTNLCADGNPPNSPPQAVRVVAADHLEEQLPPSSMAGTEFVLPRSPPRWAAQPEADVWVVMATDGGAVVAIEDATGIGRSVTLGPGEFERFESTESMIVSADNPITAGRFIKGAGATGPPGAFDLNGDPAFAMIPPSNQRRSSYSFLVPSHYLDTTITVAGETGTTFDIDGQRPACDETMLGLGAGQSVWHCRVTTGAHRLTASAPVSASFCRYMSFAASCTSLGVGADLSLLAEDFDGDGVPNDIDVCAAVADPAQDDLDGDGRGDVCDLDVDGDGCLDAVEAAHGSDPALDTSTPTTFFVDVSYAGGGSDGTSAAPFTSIGDAVEAACDGVTVEVAPGVYPERGFTFDQRDLVVRSTAGSAQTRIDMSAATLAIVLNGVNSGGLHGFEVTDSTRDSVAVIGGAPALSDLVIRRASRDALLVYEFADPSIDGLLVERAGRFGLRHSRSSGSITNVVVDDSGPVDITQIGGALAVSGVVGPLVVDGVAATANRGRGSTVVFDAIAGQLTLNNLVVAANRSYEFGAMLFANTRPGGSVDATNVAVVANQTQRLGGGIIVANVDASFQLRDFEVIGNRAGQLVGGIAAFNASGARLQNGVVSGNSAPLAAGFYAWGNPVGAVEVDGVTIAGNAGESGAGVVCERMDSARFAHSIVRDNTSVSGDSNVRDCDSFLFSSVDATVSGASNQISIDPEFVTGPGGNYYLSQTAAGELSDSPAVDFGAVDASTLPRGARTTRTDGVADSGLLDLGYHYPPTIPGSFVDADGDGVADAWDNCSSYNPLQIDCDVNGIGDACEAPLPDADGDLVPDACDICRFVLNPNQGDGNLDCPAAPFAVDPQCGDLCP